MSDVSLSFPSETYEAFGVEAEYDHKGFREHTKFQMHRFVRANLVETKGRRSKTCFVVNPKLKRQHFAQWTETTPKSYFPQFEAAKPELIANWWRDAISKGAQQNAFGRTMTKPTTAAKAKKRKRENDEEIRATKRRKLLAADCRTVEQLITRVDDWVSLRKCLVESVLLPHCGTLDAICSLITSFVFWNPLRQPIAAFVATKWRTLEWSEEKADIRRTKFKGVPFLPKSVDWAAIQCDERQSHESGSDVRYQMDFQLNASDLPLEAVSRWPKELRRNCVLQMIEANCFECGDPNPFEVENNRFELQLHPKDAEAQTADELREFVRETGRVVAEWSRREEFPYNRGQLNEAVGLLWNSAAFGSEEAVGQLLAQLNSHKDDEYRPETKTGGYHSNSAERWLSHSNECPHCGGCETPLAVLFEYYSDLYENMNYIVCCSEHPRDTVEMRYIA